MKKTIRDTMFLMMRAHKGQTDNSGYPYWVHPVMVMAILPEGAGDTARHVALLHDVVEDTAYTVDILRDYGYDEEVLDALVLLTRQRPETYTEYIAKIAASGNEIARMVKIADLTDNLRPQANTTLTARYRKALALLKNGLTEFKVHLHEERGDKFTVVFYCLAEDEDHAEEQVLSAYPGGVIVSIHQVGELA